MTIVFVYTTVVNGSGYTSYETDRFKDYAARVSITPLARGTSFFKSLVITPFAYKGASASQFVNGGAGQVGPIGEGLAKDRYGVFVGLNDVTTTGDATGAYDPDKNTDYTFSLTQ